MSDNRKHVRKSTRKSTKSTNKPNEKDNKSRSRRRNATAHGESSSSAGDTVARRSSREESEEVIKLREENAALKRERDKEAQRADKLEGELGTTKEALGTMKRERDDAKEQIEKVIKPIWYWAATAPPDLIFKRGPSGSKSQRADAPVENVRSTNTTGWPEPTAVVHWDYFDSPMQMPFDGENPCPVTTRVQLGAGITLPSDVPEVANGEPGIAAHVYNILKSAISWANAGKWIFKTLKQLTIQSPHELHGFIPDGTISDHNQNDDVEDLVRAVVEIKPWWKWNTKSGSTVGDDPTPIYLAELWKTERNVGESAIRQIFTYMACYGVEYGILTTFKHWFFLKLEVDVNKGTTNLLASTPIPALGNAPALGHALLCFFDLVQGAVPLPVNQQQFLSQMVKNSKDAKQLKKQNGNNGAAPASHSNADTFAADVGGSSSGGGGVQESVELYTSENDDTVFDHSARFPVHTLLRPSPPFIAKLPSGRTGITLRTKIRGFDAAIKIADIMKRPEMEDELKHEAFMYEKLRSLQGTVIARLLFVGDMTLCRFGLATSFQGSGFVEVYEEAVQNEDMDTVTRLKQGAESCIASLHSYGVLHGDPRGGNFCVDAQGRVSLIDLANSVILEPLEAEVQQEAKELEWKQLRWQFEHQFWDLNACPF